MILLVPVISAVCGSGEPSAFLVGDQMWRCQVDEADRPQSVGAWRDDDGGGCEPKSREAGDGKCTRRAA